MNDLLVLVQNALIDLVVTYNTSVGFPSLIYSDDKYPTVSLDVVEDVIQTVEPGSVRAMEVSGNFQMSRNTRECRLRDPQNWFWHLRMIFPSEVSLEAFKLFMNTGVQVPRADDQPTVFLDFEEFQVKHGVEMQGSAAGTEVLAVFNAKVQRPR